MSFTRACFSSLSLALAFAATSLAVDIDPRIYVRDGYTLSVALELDKARFMERSPDGVLFVSRPTESDIMSFKDTDGDGVYEPLGTFVSKHEWVHALEWHDGWLWFATPGTIHRAQDTNGDGVADEVVQILDESTLPGGREGHWWRSLMIFEDRIYTSIGDSTNLSDERGSKRQKIWSYALDGSDEKLFCSGIRNTEKLNVRPGTSEIWGLDHGTDNFGAKIESPAKNYTPVTDTLPPEELNRYEEGGFYGHPFLMGPRIPHPEFVDHPDFAKLAGITIIPEWNVPAHWAPNGHIFYTGDQFPDAKGDLFVAYHGTSTSAIQSVSRILFEDGKPYGQLPYVSFIDDDKQVLGRAVDVLMEPDGSLLISDDHKGRIYRLRHK